MIEALKSDELVKRIGGAFRLCALVQRRLKELIDGARPLVDSHGKTLVEVAIEEIAAGKVIIDYEHSEGIAPPELLGTTKEMLPGADDIDRIGNEA